MILQIVVFVCETICEVLFREQEGFSSKTRLTSEISPPVFFGFITNDLICLFTDPHFLKLVPYIYKFVEAIFQGVSSVYIKMMQECSTNAVGKGVLAKSFIIQIFSAFENISQVWRFHGLLSQSNSKEVMIQDQIYTPYARNEVCTIPF